MTASDSAHVEVILFWAPCCTVSPPSAGTPTLYLVRLCSDDIAYPSTEVNLFGALGGASFPGSLM